MENDLISNINFLKSSWAKVDFNQSDQAKKVKAPAQQKEYKSNQKIIKLFEKENWEFQPITLVDAIIQRRSIRKYSANPLNMKELSLLLYLTQGIKRYSPNYSFKTVPSAGARHPFETYFYANNVENLEKGIYRYLPLDNSIILEIEYYKGIEDDINEATLMQFWNPALFFFWAAIPYRTEYRYLNAAHKAIALDAGHLCQNLYLAAESIGCGVCAIAAYDQDLVDRLLKLDGNEEFVIYCASLGKKDIK